MHALEKVVDFDNSSNHQSQPLCLRNSEGVWAQSEDALDLAWLTISKSHKASGLSKYPFLVPRNCFSTTYTDIVDKGFHDLQPWRRSLGTETLPLREPLEDGLRFQRQDSRSSNAGCAFPRPGNQDMKLDCKAMSKQWKSFEQPLGHSSVPKKGSYFTALLGPRCVEGRGVFTKRKILGITKCALLQWDLDKHLNVGLEASKIGVQKLLCFGNM